MFFEDLPYGDYYFGIRLKSCLNCDFNLHRYVIGVWGYSYEIDEVTNNYFALGETLKKCCTLD